VKDTVNDKRVDEIADRGFHVAIASAMGRDMLAKIIESVWDRRRGAMGEKMQGHCTHPRCERRHAKTDRT
jgi:DNA-binding FadR family transcriptional regulator